MGKKRNWDQIRGQKTTDTVKYRDVFEDQQLERGNIAEKENMLSRTLLTLAISGVVFVLLWFLISLIQMFFSGSGTLELSSNPAATYLYVEEHYENLKVAMTEYNAYLKSTTNPEEGYHHVVAHYVNRNDYSDAIYIADYEKLVADYNTKLSKGKISPDMQDIPILPYNPSDYYKADSYNESTVITYRNVLDGSVISYIDYDELVNKYNQDIEKYKTKYQSHREMYHPDDIAGTKKVLKLGPNLWKVIISLGVAGIIFGLLYTILSRNLKAQNLMSDTSDINQYHNDQHVALPEEIQRNYDWFPDVGAHSAVQVSSMISHMALQNKGLKQIEFAKRAEKDILDSDGDVDYYKGEILNDDDGNIITSMEPMIDEKFMDALFDASGAPNDKEVRKRYDTTKIPYNPDGSNREKLGQFDTVADLINSDWEFPLYEPQRPAGAYIVDTAPVNTMVLAITRAGKGNMLARFVWRQAIPMC